MCWSWTSTRGAGASTKAKERACEKTQTPRGEDRKGEAVKGGTLFSGIGTPELAGPWVDWRWSAEIDPFASAVHAARFPNIPNLGDVTRFPDAVEPVGLIVFGSPCQSFSVAGKRAGLDDARGNLALIGLQIVDRVRPDWLVFENVPGLLSSDEWRDFGTFLGALGECGYGFAYRILDAQYAGVPQRRRRVFVVGYLGDWRPPAAVLFERDCLSWNSPPGRETREEVAGSLSSRATAGGGLGTDFECGGGLTVAASGRGTPIIPIQSVQAVREKRQNGIGIGIDGDPLFTLTGRDQHAIAFIERTRADGRNFEAQDDLAYALCNPGSGGRTHSRQLLDASMAVRRLTPCECERLQGFPDDFTLIRFNGKLAADGPRYRALGNAMAVPVIGWILSRIKEFQDARDSCI